MSGRHAARRDWQRFTVLHVRARGVPITVAGLAVLTLSAWLASDWLVDRQGSAGPDERWLVAAFAPLLAAVILSSGFGGADEELERTAALRWRHVRAAHVGTAIALAGVGLAVTGLWEPETYGAYELVRNTAACIGLVAAGAVVLGARLGWVPAFGYVLFVVAVASRDPGTAWWAWPVHTWASDAANWSAAVVGAAGMAVYVRFGSRRTVERP